MKISMKKRLLAIVSAAALGGAMGSAQAANWLMLQGTESPDNAPRAKVWGFIQVQYQKDYSTANSSNEYIPPKLIGPTLSSQSQFNVNRARVGVRGTGFPLDSKVNYFVLLEMGKNAITNANGAMHITDSSITLNHIPGARIRMGLFKTPGAEEGLQAIHVFDYINFTNVTNQMMLERFQSGFTGSNVAPQTLPVQNSLNTFDRPVGAFRDVGIQIFDAFKTGNWEQSYAVMYGNGNGLNFGDNDNNKELYVYFATELLLGGKGPRREGLKMFAWSQTGKRSFDGNNDGIVDTYDRNRYGAGVKYMKKPFRFTAEYMLGDGMIFNGPDKSTYGLVPASVNNPNHPGSGLKQKADGYYVEGGWYIPNSNWELDLRYDTYNRLTDNGGALELQFTTLTLGTQYHFNKKTRLTVNYEIRDAKAVDFASGAGPNANLDGVGDRASIQMIHIF